MRPNLKWTITTNVNYNLHDGMQKINMENEVHRGNRQKHEI